MLEVSDSPVLDSVSSLHIRESEKCSSPSKDAREVFTFFFSSFIFFPSLFQMFVGNMLRNFFVQELNQKRKSNF